MKKLSVTGILSQIFPMPEGVFTKALSADKLSAKKEKGELVPNGIAFRAGELKEEWVMQMLTSLGTTVHSCAFDLGTIGMCDDFKGTIAEGLIRTLKQFFIDYKAVAIHAEMFMECEEYTGTSDGIYQVTIPETGEIEYWLLDWKTWGAYKSIYGIIELKKPSKSSEVKKVSVQLSMYQRMFDKDFVGEYKHPRTGIVYPLHGKKAIWIHESGYTVYECKTNIQPFLDWQTAKDAIPTTKLSLTV